MEGNITALQQEVEDLRMRKGAITIPPSIKVVLVDGFTLTVQSRIRASTHDLVTVVLRLRNDGGPGTAIVRIRQTGWERPAYIVLEKAYVLPQSTEQAFTETFLASPDAPSFVAEIVQQIPA